MATPTEFTSVAGNLDASSLVETNALTADNHVVTSSHGSQSSSSTAGNNSNSKSRFLHKRGSELSNNNEVSDDITHNNF